MSLIEPHAPLAPEEKSVDKLEIELEEKEQMISGEAVPAPDQNGTEEAVVPKKDTPRRPNFNIKIPQILRKRSKERPPDKQEKKEERAEMIGGEEKPLKEDSEVPAEIQIEIQAPATEGGPKDEDKENKARPLDTSTTSFSFSTPKWINFRRVFSFNRSTPTTMANKETRFESVIPVSVTLDISEDSVLARTKKLPEDDFSNAMLIEANEKNGKGGQEPEGTPPKKNGLNPEPTFMTPLIRLFRSRRTQNPPKDVEGGEVATELLEKTGSEPNGLGSKMPEEEQKDGTEGGGETKSSPKHENKTSSELLSGVVMTGEKGGKGPGPEPLLKPTPDLWRQRLAGLTKQSKWILGGISVLLALLVLLVCLAAFRATKAIDIATLIIGGKYINTITSCGHVQGVVEDGGYAFRGIPYAIPPVGELRWRPAQTHSHLNHCWNGTFEAKSHSMPCWQFYRNGSYGGSEDCLYLDIYTPKPYYDAPSPVVVFIGGESMNGGQSASLRPSAALARAKNVVFISVSIRRSVLGFLTVDALSRNSYPMTSGNYGLSDLLAALHWVRYNAEHFGGDKHHVTLLGHQSGASLVSALMTSHLSKGLFHQVWVSGGSPPSTLINVQEAEAQNSKFLKEVGCSSIECLHNKGPEELLESVPYDWRAFHQDLPTRGESRHHWLVRDGVILREPLDDPSERPLTPPPVSIPFVAGAPAEVDASPEMFSYLNWNDSNKFSTYLESKLGSFGPSLSREVLDRYFRPESTSWQTYASLLSDVRTVCPLYYTTMARADPYNKTPVYFYVVKQRKAAGIGLVADANSDLSAIFGLYDPMTRDETKYVANMQRLFYEFVEKGKLPEGDLDVTKSIYLVDESIQKIFTYPNCDFWLEHGFYPNHTRID